MGVPSRFEPPTGRPLGRTAALVLGGCAVLTALVVAVGWLYTHPLHSWLRGENGVNRWFVRQRTSDLTHVADGGTLTGQTLTGLVVLALLGLVFAAVRRTWWPLVFVGVLDAGVGVFYLAGTQLDPRQRPPVHILQSGLVQDASFPSGHTGTATAIAGVAAALLWSYTRVAGSALALLVLIPAYTMVSRLYVGAHHVSDVLAAFAYTSVWVFWCSRLLLPGRGRQEQAQPAEQ